MDKKSGGKSGKLKAAFDRTSAGRKTVRAKRAFAKVEQARSSGASERDLAEPIMKAIVEGGGAIMSAPDEASQKARSKELGESAKRLQERYRKKPKKSK